MVMRKTSPEFSRYMSSCSPFVKVNVQYRNTLRALLDELEMYQPLTGDVSQMKRHWEELAVSIYLFSLNSDLSSQIRRQILGADSLPDLHMVFSKPLRVSTGPSTSTSTFTSTPESSAMAATKGRGSGGFRGN